MSNAEATLRHSILSGMIKNWHKKDSPDFAQMAVQSVLEEISEPTKRWATEEYLKETNPKQS
jgi:hypothetical protein